MSSVSIGGGGVGGAAGKSGSGRNILESLNFRVPHIKVPSGYVVALFLLATFLILMAAAFAALFVFLLWLIVWHLRSAVVSLDQGPYFIFHVPMALLGVLLLVFLVKPLCFGRKRDESHILKLTRSDEPLLYEFVTRLCAATQSQSPAYIEIDCEANAGARLRSVVNGDLVLRVGLPLVGGMPVNQFAGVLAHEFGHFNQRGGMRGAYLIRRLMFFFAKIVFQRDRLDAYLMRLRTSRNGVANLFYWIAVAFIEPMRGVLWLMMVVGELLTCHVMRRMEYDADNVNAHVAGVGEFIRTSQQIAFLAVAAQQARHDLEQAFKERRLADDLPRLIVANANQLAEHRDDILKSLEKERTKWIDTHPCHNDRIQSVQRTGANGLFHCDTPAKYLFNDFDALCKKSTEAFYRAMLKKDFAGIKLVPTAELVEGRGEERAAFTALRKFFRGQVTQGRPVLPDQDVLMAPDDLEGTIATLRAARDAVVEMAAKLDSPAEQHESAAGALVVAQAQLALCSLFPRNPRVARLYRQATGNAKSNQTRLAAAGRELDPFEVLTQRRMSCGLRLLQCEEIVAKLDAESRDAPQRVAELVDVLRTLEPQLKKVLSLRQNALTIRVLHSAYNPKSPYRPLVGRVLETNKAVVDALVDLRHDLHSKPYPFSHGTEGATMGSAIVERLPDGKNPFDTHACAMMAFDRYSTVLFRSLGQLADWAAKAETAAGLETLPDLPARNKKSEAAEKAKNARNHRRYWLAYGARAAAGIAFLTVLVGWSVDPPELPAMSWGDAPARAYRPASFGMSASVSTFTTQYQPMVPRGYVGPPLPGQPGYIRPGQPGYRPPQPGYPNGRNPNNPNPNPNRGWFSPAPNAPGGGGGFRGGGGPVGGHR